MKEVLSAQTIMPFQEVKEKIGRDIERYLNAFLSNVCCLSLDFPCIIKYLTVYNHNSKKILTFFLELI